MEAVCKTKRCTDCPHARRQQKRWGLSWVKGCCAILLPCRLGFEGNHLWEAYVGLASLVFGYNLAGYLVLRFTKPKYLPLTKKHAKKQQ